MLRLKTIVNEETGKVSVIEENATVLSKDDVVLDSVSYDMLMYELEMLRENYDENKELLDGIGELLISLNKVPKWILNLLDVLFIRK